MLRMEVTSGLMALNVLKRGNSFGLVKILIYKGHITMEFSGSPLRVDR